MTQGHSRSYVSAKFLIFGQILSRKRGVSVMLAKSNQDVTLKSDYHGVVRNYEGVNMEATKSILEEISSGKYNEVVDGMSTYELKTYSEVIHIMVKKSTQEVNVSAANVIVMGDLPGADQVSGLRGVGPQGNDPAGGSILTP
ncbi:hypothetical protein Tco_0244393, partial [Tanacetum coccineum]